MALKACKECKKDVSTGARTCPHCGVKNPTLTTREMWLGMTGLILLLVVVYFIFSDDKSESQQAVASVALPAKTVAQIAAEKVEAERVAAACRVDLRCLGGKYLYQAARQCAPKLERYAKHDVRWTEGFGGKKFSRMLWGNEKKGIILYAGDKVQFQNGFGAYTNYVYECEYDTINEKVIKTNVVEGRF